MLQEINCLLLYECLRVYFLIYQCYDLMNYRLGNMTIPLFGTAYRGGMTLYLSSWRDWLLLFWLNVRACLWEEYHGFQSWWHPCLHTSTRWDRWQGYHMLYVPHVWWYIALYALKNDSWVSLTTLFECHVTTKKV